MNKQLYALDALAFIGAVMTSANDVMWFWYCAAAYIVFKSCLIYTLKIFRKDSISYEIDKEVDRKLTDMANRARRQLSRGDHSPITFYH